MKRLSWKISNYTLLTILPYFAFTWLLLSVILFVQQASRYSDIFFSNNIPSSLIWQLTVALIPSVIAFTCPMAALVGVVIGLSKMQGDSELIALRAAGVGNRQIALPVAALGLLLSIFAFLVNLWGVPIAAQLARKVGIQAAILKLESPIEPGVFNTEIQGYTIYVKKGDLNSGAWENIFIYNEDKQTKQVRLITAKNGRIDYKDNNSELVLERASISTFSMTENAGKIVSENVGNLRLAIHTKRSELIDRLSKAEETPEELGLADLAGYAATKEGKERTEAEILWQRRIILSITPLIFVLLGTALVLRFNRGGKGWGIFLALTCLISYYLIALFSEQLARTGKISVATAAIFPIILSIIAIIWFFASARVFSSNLIGKVKEKLELSDLDFFKSRRGGNLINTSTAILDFDIVASLVRYFLAAFVFLAATYLIFTAFELWKFAGNIDNGIVLLGKYLFYLLPFIYIQIAPSALMIATLSTYVIKSRQNEVVTWTASGLSIYRLLFPCFLFMLTIGGINWTIQEKILPVANRTQDDLRAQIRNKGVLATKEGKNWVTTENRIYSFELDKNQQNSANPIIKNVSLFQFDEKMTLSSLTRGVSATWDDGRIVFHSAPERTFWVDGMPQVMQATEAGMQIEENYNPFKQIIRKPGHLNTSEIAEYLKTAGSESERHIFAVALEKRYSTILLPFIITLFTAPFALSLSRKGKVVTISYAVGIWLLFIGITSGFEQMGLSGHIGAKAAIWGPLVLFSALGVYLMSKVRS